MPSRIGDLPAPRLAPKGEAVAQVFANLLSNVVLGSGRIVTSVLLGSKGQAVEVLAEDGSRRVAKLSLT